MNSLLRWLTVLVVIVVGAGIVFWVQSSGPAASEYPDETTITAETPLTQSEILDVVQETGETKEFAVTAKRYAYNPSTITVNRGDRVKLLMKSIDVVHGFALPDFGVEARLPVAETVEVEFLADKAGTFEFFSNIFSGKGTRGMVGELIVK